MAGTNLDTALAELDAPEFLKPLIRARVLSLLEQRSEAAHDIS